MFKFESLCQASDEGRVFYAGEPVKVLEITTSQYETEVLIEFTRRCNCERDCCSGFFKKGLVVSGDSEKLEVFSE